MASKRAHGQVFSGEFLLGFILFTASLAIVMTLWDMSLHDVLSSEGSENMEEVAVVAAETLVRTPGSPLDWNGTNVNSLGLANESRVLSAPKVSEFVKYMSPDDTDMCSVAGGKNYDCNLHMLGLGGYDFFLNMTYLNGSAVVLNGTEVAVGKMPENETDSVTVVRTAILNDELTRVYLTVWR